jgi:hypothetical protein
MNITRTKGFKITGEFKPPTQQLTKEQVKAQWNHEAIKVFIALPVVFIAIGVFGMFALIVLKHFHIL